MSQDTTSSPNSVNTMLAEVPGGLNDLACAIYERNVQKGFYEKPKNIGEMLCLIHSEVSEALEADRKESYANLIGFEAMLWKDNQIESWQEVENFKVSFSGTIKNTFEDEMADIIIRVLDLCAFKGIDIEKHIALKMQYNATREKYHGKKY